MAQNNIAPGYPFGIILALIGVGVLIGAIHGNFTGSAWLDEQEEQATTIPADAVNPAHEGKLVHVTGRIQPLRQVWTDPRFGVTAEAFALARVVQVHEYIGGDGGPGYTWSRVGPLLDAEPKTVPTAPLTKVWKPTAVRLGAFTLTPAVLSEIVRQAANSPPPEERQDRKKLSWEDKIVYQVAQAETRLPLTHVHATHLPTALRPQWFLTTDGMYYKGEDPGQPKEGDQRVSYRVVDLGTGTITLLCRQTGNQLDVHSGTRSIRPFLVVTLEAADMATMFTLAREVHEGSMLRMAIGGGCVALAGFGVLYLTYRWGRARRRQLAAITQETNSPGDQV